MAMLSGKSKCSRNQGGTLRTLLTKRASGTSDDNLITYPAAFSRCFKPRRPAAGGGAFPTRPVLASAALLGVRDARWETQLRLPCWLQNPMIRANYFW